MVTASGIFQTGSNLDIDAAAERLTNANIVCVFGVLVRADTDNAGDVYVGVEGVTAGTAAATDGIRLKPGDAVSIEIDNPGKIFVIATVANQKAWWVAV